MATDVWAGASADAGAAMLKSTGSGADRGDRASNRYDAVKDDSPGWCDQVLRVWSCGICGSADMYVGEGPWVGGRDGKALLAPGQEPYGEPDATGAGVLEASDGGAGGDEAGGLLEFTDGADQ